MVTMMSFNADVMKRVGCLVAAVCIAFVGRAGAQQPEATALDTSAAAGFVGEWTLTMEMQGNPVEVALTVADVDGKLGAVVVVPQLPNAVVASDIDKTPEGLDMLFPVEFAGQSINLTLTLALVQKVSGTLADDAGMLSVAVEGTRATEPEQTVQVEVELKPSELDTSAMGSYIGTWELSMEIGGRPFNVTLQFLDLDGKVTALFQSVFNPQPENIHRISLSEEGARLSFDTVVAGQSAPMDVWITRASDTMEGTLSAMGGALRAEFIGEPSDKDLLAALTNVDPNTRRRSRGGGTRQADVTVDGSEIRVRYTALKEDSSALESLSELKSGDVLKYADGRTIKLLSDADLVFGDAILKTENAGPDYPGVYGLWLKKSAEGWTLVANQHADILGTQYDPSADVAEILVQYAVTDEDAGPMTIELVEGERGGVLSIRWREHAWTARFSLGEHTIAESD